MSTTAKYVVASMSLAAVVLGQVAATGAEGRELPAGAVVDVQTCLPAGHIRMDGHIGRRMADCMENLVTAWDLDRLVKPFRDKTDGADDQWRGDYWGKWFTALAWGCAHQPTAEHRRLLDRAVKQLIATQGPNGNIGTFAGEKRLVGAYDIWARQCVILGLVADYDLTADKAALDAACRELDCLIGELNQKKLRIPDLSWPEFKGLAPSVVVESGALLYQRTGLKKYRDFSERIVAQWNEPSKLLPKGLRLVDDALAGKPAREVGHPKAYEQLHCFIGVCELYRATGNRKYLDAAVALARNIRADELFVTGTGSEHERWFKGQTQQTRVVVQPAETCVTTHWMYLCWQLLRLTGDPIYADEMETSLDNALLGALMPDGHWWAYHEGLMGQRVPSWVAQADVGLSCCVVSGSRGLMLTPFWAVMQAKNGPVVNLYFSGQFEAKTGSGGSIGLTIQTEYPREGTVHLSVTRAAPETFTLAVRIPSWSRETTLKVNDQLQPAKPGTYAEIQRKWAEGDRIELILDMRTRVLNAPDGNGQVALKRGPIVLALDDRLTPAEKGAVAVLERNAASPAGVKPNLEAAQKAGVWMAFDVPFFVNGTKRALTMCDYASAGNRWSQDNQFRTWLPQPLNLGTAYQTATTWRTVSLPEGAKPQAPDIQAERGVGLDDLALSSKGTTATADSQFTKEPSSPLKAIDGVIAGPWDSSNRWVSSLETPHPHWIEVKLRQAAQVGTIVVRFADPAGHPTSFQGLVGKDGKDLVPVFDVTGYKNPRYFRTAIPPVIIDTFRLVIRASANPACANAAQISEIELYSPTPHSEQHANTRWGGRKVERILFLGNSITLVRPAAWCDWKGNWGMAASAEDKDYVHLLVHSLAGLAGNQPEIMVENIAEFERQYATYAVNANLKKHLDFKPDIVVVAIGENVPALGTDEAKANFRVSFSRLLSAIRNAGQPAICVRSCFWADKSKDDILRQCCAEIGGVFVDIGGLGRDESNMARSERKFKHDGVAGHPGDKGMKAIADAIFIALTSPRGKSSGGRSQ
jgi:hypothetical protein